MLSPFPNPVRRAVFVWCVAGHLGVRLVPYGLMLGRTPKGDNVNVAVAVDGLRVMVRDVRRQNGRLWVTGVDAYVCEACRLVWDWSHMVAIADTDLEFK